MTKRPPRLAERLIERSLEGSASWHGVLGDLEEEYRLRCTRGSTVASQLWYWREAVSIWCRLKADRRASLSTVASLAQDVRIAARGMRKRPGYALTTALTLSLGIGGATTMFSLVLGILVRPLPYPDSGRLVAVWPESWASHAFLRLLENDIDARRLQSFESIGAFAPRIHVVQEADGAHEVAGPRVSVGFVETLGLPMQLGRAFSPGEDEAGSDAVLILSDAYWATRYGRDPGVVGATVHLRGADHTVIGVLAPGFDLFQAGAQILVPQSIDPTDPSGAQELKLIGRLRAGVTLEQATSGFLAYTDGLREELGLPADWNEGADLVSLQEWLVGDVRSTLVLLFAAAALLVVIAGVNVMGLTLARSLARHGEVSVRRALGASRLRIARLLWTEGIIMGLLGAGLGSLVAWWSLPALGSLLIGLAPESLYNVAADGLPRLGEVALDGSALLFAGLVGIALGTAAGWPGVRLRRNSHVGALGTRGAPAASGPAAARARRALVSIQVALAVVLLTGSALLASSLAKLSAVDPGFLTQGLLVLSMSPDRERWRAGDELQAAVEDLRDRLAALPGVTGVATATELPLAPTSMVSGSYRADVPPPEPGTEPITQWRVISHDYFDVVGIPVVAGRRFLDSDRPESEDVAIVSESAASVLFGADDPLGHPIIVGMEAPRLLTVVGVVGDLGERLPEAGQPPLVYRPWSQASDAIQRFGLITRAIALRTANDPSLVLESVPRLVRETDPRALIRGLQPMPDVIASTRSRPRAILILVGIFTALAVTLAAIGVFGVVSYLARERSRELAIRTALGATRRQIQLAVAGEGMRVALAGMGGGLTLSILGARALRGFVFETDVLDPRILAAGALLTGVITLGASALPAWRTGRVAPSSALSE